MLKYLFRGFKRLSALFGVVLILCGLILGFVTFVFNFPWMGVAIIILLFCLFAGYPENF